MNNNQNNMNMQNNGQMNINPQMNAQMNPNQQINNQINNNQQYSNNQPAQKNIQKEFSKKKESKTVKLKRFKYKVKEQDGKIIESYFDAENQVDVQSFLLNKGYEIVSITEDKLSTSLGLTSMSSSKKMNSKDLNFFLTQLSTYVKSGIPLVESMEILSRQAKNKSIQALYKKIVFELNRGTTFSRCLEKQGKVFPKMLINMLKTSEMTGDLTGVLDDMAAYYKQQDTNRKQIINAMTYPSVLMIFAVTVLTFVLMYVVPSFTSMYSSAGAELPMVTKIVMSISDFIVSKWYFVLLVVVVVVTILVLLYKSSKGAKYAMQSFVMHIPVVSDMIKYNQLVTFTGTFSTLIKHDVFITDSMDILSKITENEIYKKIIDDAIKNLSKGNGVSVAFKGHWAFPATAYEMLVTGERTGKLGEMMQHVTDYYQEE
ncbi:MAG: type II secretion system F family protein, partial [Bacilli bacterium]|nr:type II secretion system F family protein [Bacilli bacterium]